MSSALRLMENKEEALARMMAEHGDSLLRMCCLYLKDRALAEDAVQETFLKAYRGMDAFRGEAQEKTWLTRIAINVCSDMLRKPWHKWVDHFKAPEDAGHTQEMELEDDTVSAAVMKLTKNYRAAILLRYYQGLSVKEIADMMGKPPSTISTWLARARETLYGTLKGWYFDEE